MYILTSLLTEFDQELHDRCTREAGYEEGVADGMAEGITKGAQQTAITNAKNLLQMNLGTPEQISQAVSLPLEQVLALKSEMVQA